MRRISIALSLVLIGVGLMSLSLIGGEVTIEIAKPDEISIRAYGNDTAG